MGIDLSDPKVYSTVCSMYGRIFAKRVRAAGLDEEDTLQDMLTTMVSRNGMRSGYDPTRGKLEAWAYHVMHGVLLNLIAKQQRRVVYVGMEREYAAAGCAGESTLADLAWEMDVPDEVVRALVDGADVFGAAIDGGCSPEDARAITLALGAA